MSTKNLKLHYVMFILAVGHRRTLCTLADLRGAHPARAPLMGPFILF